MSDATNAADSSNRTVPPIPNSESGNTYVFDPESPAELARLINVDRIVTRGMGGPLSGLTRKEIAGLHNVLDLACGPGGWVLDVAFEHPNIEVAGVDISRAMIDYANARASSQRLTNASFGIMDINKPFEFSDNSFDLVNTRFLTAVLSRDSWEPFIAEATRILRPGGILRLTEMDDLSTSTSPTLMRLNDMGYQALWRTGYAFSPDGHSLCVTVKLPHILRRAGYQHVQHRAHALEFSADTENWIEFYRNLEVFWLLSQPFLVQLGMTTQEEIERLYQQMLSEMRQPDFCLMWHHLTVWGTKP